MPELYLDEKAEKGRQAGASLVWLLQTFTTNTECSVEVNGGSAGNWDPFIPYYGYCTVRVAKKELDTVCIVTSGTYSDYSIDGVLASREKAENAIKGCSDEYRIEEWSFGAISDNNRYTFNMLRDGSVPYMPFVTLGVSEESTYDFQHGPRVELRCHVVADSAKRAIKIANEKRAQLIADGTWDREAT